MGAKTGAKIRKRPEPGSPKEGSGLTPAVLLFYLLLAYLMTAALLLLLSAALYRLGLSEKMAAQGIIAIYLVATVLAGFLSGRKAASRKFLWGLLMGAAYFLVLVFLSLLVNRSVGGLTDSFLPALLLCAGGGMMGGMLS